MGLNDVLQHLRRSPTFMRGVTAWKTLPAREGRYAEFPTALDYRLRDALRARGIERLYTHQAASIAATNWRRSRKRWAWESGRRPMTAILRPDYGALSVARHRS